MSFCLSGGGSHLEEFLGGARVNGAVLDLSLLGEVVCRLDRRVHPLDREEGGQVGRVRRDDDESEEPPDAADDPTRHRPGEDRLVKTDEMRA